MIVDDRGHVTGSPGSVRYAKVGPGFPLRTARCFDRVMTPHYPPLRVHRFGESWMDPTKQVVLASQLHVARDLISRRSFDVKATSALLKALPADLGHEAKVSVEEALADVRAAAKGGGGCEASARYALARVITMLERETHRSSVAT